MSTVDTYEDFAEWYAPRPAATVGEAAREFTATPVETLLAWFSRYRETEFSRYRKEMSRPRLAAWLAEAGYEACGEQLAAVSPRRAPATAHRIADAIDGMLAEHDELLPEKLREFAYVTEAALAAPALYARLAAAASAMRARQDIDGMYRSFKAGIDRAAREGTGPC